MANNASLHPGDQIAVEPLILFEILVRENADTLMAFLRAAVADQASADDLFQETMLIAWRKIGQYDRNRPFGAWLRGIARNLVLAHHRLATRELACPEDQVLRYLDERMAQIDRHPGDTFDEKIQALRGCIRRLDPLYQQPIELHYHDQKSAEWIARRLATTTDAIQKRLQRARVQLAECLERKGILATPREMA